jgi:hypothetical protein
VRSECKECGGGSICDHGRQRSQCKECGGGSICEHGRVRSKCRGCRRESFEVGQVVWARVKGYPWWPGLVTCAVRPIPPAHPTLGMTSQFL